MSATKPGRPESMELARALSASIRAADVERRRVDALNKALHKTHLQNRRRMIDEADALSGRNQVLSLILAVLAGASATLAAVLPMVPL